MTIQERVNDIPQTILITVLVHPYSLYRLHVLITMYLQRANIPTNIPLEIHTFQSK